MPSSISHPDANVAGAAPQEIELKLALPPQSATTLLAQPLLTAHAPVKQTLANAYFDTPDATLAAARIALRLRQIDGITLQTLKTAGHGGGGLSTRNEWEWEVPGDSGLDLAGLADLPPMRELDRDTLSQLAVQLHTDFTRHRVEVTHGHSVIEVAVDQGEIVSGKARARICELELELKAGAPEALWELADTLAEAVALRPSDSSKAARGNALGTGHWPLPDAHTPDEWLHRAFLALDAFHDSSQADFLHAAQRALKTLEQHPGLTAHEQPLARALVSGLGHSGQPTTAFGQAALALSRRLARRAPLR